MSDATTSGPKVRTDIKKLAADAGKKGIPFQKAYRMPGKIGAAIKGTKASGK